MQSLSFLGYAECVPLQKPHPTAPSVVSDARGPLCAVTPTSTACSKARLTAKGLLSLAVLAGSLAFPRVQGRGELGGDGQG